MEWTILLIIFFGSLVILMATGLPIAFGFMVINIIGILILWGPQTGLDQFIFSIFGSVTKFTLVPLPMFILMGEVLFQAELAPSMLAALDRWLGKLPGRSSLLTIAAGVLIATLTGVSMAAVAMLGSVLEPEMRRRGYSKSMTLGPIMGAGGLAIMIPPSSMAVIVGAIGEISIGKILIATILPGILMAVIDVGYIVIRCKLQPSLAPSYDVRTYSLAEKLSASAKYIAPVAFVIFLVTGLILLGVATPTEAAALGAFGCFVLAAFYRKLTGNLIKKSFIGTLTITVMIFMIVAGASAFSQILSFSGATIGITQFATSLPVHPIVIIIMTQVIVFVLGCFMDVVAILMITLPIFVPVVIILGFDPVWFAVLMMINVEVAGISPPFGLSLFVMKGIASKDTTMGDIYRAGLPFCGLSLLAMVIIMIFPEIATWLPNLGK